MEKFTRHQNSYFLSLEGIEGSGKTTQITNIKTHFESKGYTVTIHREPGGTTYGEKLRQAILESNEKICPLSEAYLFASSRAQLLTQKILPLLQEDQNIVILDRYIDSSVAYQGFARELGIETILNIHSYFPLNQLPDITFYLKIDLETSMLRQQARGNEKDYFESENNHFYQKLIDGYDTCAQKFPERIKIINATQSPDEVFSQIKSICERL